MRILFGVVLLGLSLNGPKLAAEATVPDLSTRLLCEDQVSTADKIETAQKKSGEDFLRYLKSLKNSLLERDYVVDLNGVQLLTGEHSLLMGPAGIAKSKAATLALSHVLEADGKPSFWKRQFSPETTLSDLYGPISFKALTEEDRQRRNVADAMVMHRFAFGDEFLDAPPRVLRYTLENLNERTASDGATIHDGLLHTFIGATNKYTAEAYDAFARNGYPEGLRAVFDRIYFKAFVPSEFMNATSDLKLLEGSTFNPVTPIQFTDVQNIQTLLPKIDIPLSSRIFLSILAREYEDQSKKAEFKSVSDYEEAKKAGGNPELPYRQTTSFTKRTLAKTPAVLKAIVAIDYLQKKGQRPLSVTIEDIGRLGNFIGLVGPRESGTLEELMNRAVNPFERNQLSIVIQERYRYVNIFKQLTSAYNEALIHTGIDEVVTNLKNFADAPENTRNQKMVPLLEKAGELAVPVNAIVTLRPFDMTPRLVAEVRIKEMIEGRLQTTLGPEKFKSQVEILLKQMDEAVEKHRLAKEEEVLGLQRQAEAAEMARHELNARLHLLKDKYKPESWSSEALDLKLDTPKTDGFPHTGRSYSLMARAGNQIYLLNHKWDLAMFQISDNADQIRASWSVRNLNHVISKVEAFTNELPVSRLFASEREPGSLYFVRRNSLFKIQLEQGMSSQITEITLARNPHPLPATYSKSTDRVYLLGPQSEDQLNIIAFDGATQKKESVFIPRGTLDGARFTKAWDLLQTQPDTIQLFPVDGHPAWIGLYIYDGTQMTLSILDLEKKAIRWTRAFGNEEFAMTDDTASAGQLSQTFPQKDGRVLIRVPGKEEFRAYAVDVEKNIAAYMSTPNDGTADRVGNFYTGRLFWTAHSEVLRLDKVTTAGYPINGEGVHAYPKETWMNVPDPQDPTKLLTTREGIAHLEQTPGGGFLWIGMEGDLVLIHHKAGESNSDPKDGEAVQNYIRSLLQ